MSIPLHPDTILLLDKCCSVGCEKTSTKKCAGCRFAQYCSPSCQKRDWKSQQKQACPRLSTIHLFLPPSAKPTIQGSPSLRILQVSPTSTPIHVIETGKIDTLHLQGINPSDRHPFPGSLPNLAILLPKLNPPIQDGSLLHVTLENIFTLYPRDREFMDPLFRFLREQTDLRTVDILFSHPLDAYNLGYLDVPETFRSIYEADPARAWKREATPGMGNKEKEKEKEGEGFVPGVSLLQLTIGFLLPLVQWIGREEEPVCFPSLRP